MDPIRSGEKFSIGTGGIFFLSTLVFRTDFRTPSTKRAYSPFETEYVYALYSGGRIAVITFPYDLKKQYGAEDENLETLIDVARCVKGVEVAAAIRQPTEENRFRVSMRSSTDFDVSEICALYGGGGHERASGCTLNSDSILAAEMTIVSAVENKFATDAGEEE